MTEDQLKRAREIRSYIYFVEDALAKLEVVHNEFAIPEDMLARHKAEIKVYLEDHRAKLQAEFDAL